MSLKSGQKIVPVSGRAKELCALFKGRDTDQVYVQPGNWLFNKSIKDFANQYQDFKWYEDDVIVSTFPKSGTTWTQEIVWTIRNNVNLDNPQGNLPLAARSPIVDADFCVTHCEKPKALVNGIAAACPDYDQSKGVFIKNVELSPRPRTIKCHLGLPMLRKDILDKTKIIYVIRDPRDTFLSYFHHCKVFTYEQFEGTLEQFADAFMEDCVLWGSYWSHVSNAWAQRNHPNMLITFYEVLKRSPKEEYKRIANFLGVKATDEQIEKIIHHTSFAEMKKRDDHVLPAEDAAQFMIADIMDKEGGFFRKGNSGDYKKSLSAEVNAKFDVWIKENCPDPEIMKIIRGD